MANSFEIGLSDIGKKYKRWIFRDVNLRLEDSQRHAVIGQNGSGKSTLLKIISGYTSPTQGRVDFLEDGKKLDGLSAPKKVSYAAPYIDLIEELTVIELANFHANFQPLHRDVSKIQDFLTTVQLSSHGDIAVGDLSSGLMQRLKVGLALLSITPVLLLDEPTSYLDLQGKAWFKEMLERYASKRLVIIASNEKEDVASCQHVIDIQEWQR
jgi:ABC-type multidrug transport system ATPase subunit